MPWGRHRGGGGYPYPIMPCNISQNAMGQTPGGVPCQVQPGGVPCWGVPCQGGYPAGGYPTWVPPSQVRTGVPCPRGTLPGYPLGRVPPPARSGRGVPCWGGYPVRTTEGVLTTRRAVCLLRSRRRTFLFVFYPKRNNVFISNCHLF